MTDPYCEHCGVADNLHNKMYCNLIQRDQHTFMIVYKKMNHYKHALERIRDCDWVITLPDRMDAVRAIAREALE
jgi:recombinational DNA repair protein RecR